MPTEQHFSYILIHEPPIQFNHIPSTISNSNLSKHSLVSSQSLNFCSLLVDVRPDFFLAVILSMALFGRNFFQWVTHFHSYCGYALCKSLNPQISWKSCFSMPKTPDLKVRLQPWLQPKICLVSKRFIIRFYKGYKIFKMLSNH